MGGQWVRIGFFTNAAVLLLAFSVGAAETIKIGHIDPMSGSFADVGERANKQMRAVIDEINAKGGVLGGRKFELVTFDNKMSAQESLLALGQVTDQGIRFITQGNGSHAAGALISGIDKIYQRTSEKSVLFLNYAAIDAELTNEKCSFWHYRFDSNTDMKVAAIVNYLASQKDLKKVYIIGQDYALGQAVSATAKRMLAEKRPDIEIVGDDLHPVGKVKDFSPYVAKIQASGAQAVITANWGNDLTLMVKAAKDSGLSVHWHTFFAGGGMTAGAIGEAGIGQVHQVSEFNTNIPNEEISAFADKFEKEYKASFYYLRIKTMMEMLANAIDQAQSADPLKVAKALEGMKFQSDTGQVWMRPEDHQLMFPMYISSMDKAGPQLALKHDVEGSGFGFKTDGIIKLEDSIQPTTCEMVRP